MSTKKTVALNELESARVLSDCGIRMVRSVLIEKMEPETLRRAAAEVGFPAVMKVVSDDILHKTDAGCVKLNLNSLDALAAAYDEILTNAASYAPDARIQGVVLQQMLPKGFEVLLGVSTDPQFGPVIMVGLGGILVELLHAVSLRILPITRADALDMIRETPLEAACQGLRGMQYDKEEIVSALLQLSRLVEEQPDIREIDVNPLLLYADGRPATAVDAVVIRAGA